MKKIEGIVKQYWYTIESYPDDKIQIIYRLYPPENLKIYSAPKILDFYRKLPFSPEDIKHLPDKKREITEEDIEFEMDVLRSAGAPFANDPKKLREEAIKSLKRKNITKKEAEAMLKEAEKEFKKAFEEFKKEHEQVLIVPPEKYKGKVEPYTVWVRKGEVKQ